MHSDSTGRALQLHRKNIGSDEVKIRRLAADEMDAACEVIGLAFTENPNTLAVAGGDRVKARWMMQAAVRAAKLGRKYSHVLVAAEGPWLVGVLNAAVWPHCQWGLYEKLKTAPALFRAMGSALTRQLKITSAWEKHEPHKPHWHLGPIGVHPLLQGRGIGKALLQSFLAMVDEQELPAYLETDVDLNVALYEKFGFNVIAEELFGINNRFMWRHARRSQPDLELHA